MDRGFGLACARESQDGVRPDHGWGFGLARARDVLVAEGRRHLVPGGITEGARLGARRRIGDSRSLKGGQDAGLVLRRGAGCLDHGYALTVVEATIWFWM